MEALRSLATAPQLPPPQLTLPELRRTDDLSWFGATPTGQGRCGVRLTVLDETSSGEHKFKLTALFLNQLGGKDMFGGWTAKNALFSKEEAAKREAKEAAKPV